MVLYIHNTPTVCRVLSYTTLGGGGGGRHIDPASIASRRPPTWRGVSDPPPGLASQTCDLEGGTQRRGGGCFKMTSILHDIRAALQTNLEFSICRQK